MKALIKFLPIEGEIKEGDFIINSGNLGEVVSIGKHATKVLFDYPAESYIPITNSIFKKTAKKVKPFVVTQDIKVGDKIVDITDKGEREGLRFIVEREERMILG